jgi:ABC-type antimicrobial peptide transport system permease subunit
MFKNYFKTTLRNLTKNKSYLFVNILGLTLGITCALLLFILLRFQYSTDTFHQDSERIFRVMNLVKNDKTGENFSYSQAPVALVHGIRATFPQIQATAVYHESWKSGVRVVNEKTGEDKKYQQKVTFAEPDFFEIFSFPFIQGEPRKALSEPNSVAISESLAQKFFGNEPALGKIVRWTNYLDLKVTGVVKDFPANTDFPFEFIISDKTRFQDWKTDYLQDWNIDWGRMVFVKLPENLQATEVSATLSKQNKEKMRKENLTLSHQLQPLAKQHWDIYSMNFASQIPEFIFIILGTIGLLLILTACINFVNLATAQAINRSREVGIRKVLGSSRKALIFQFMSEALVITLFSVLIAWSVAHYFLGAMNRLLEYRIGNEYLTAPETLVFLAITTVIVTFLSGFYPALVLSGFNPILAIKNSITTRHSGGISLRKGLVVMQFMISQLMIIFSVIMVKQSDFLKTKDLGFNKDAIITITLPKADSTRLYTFKSEFLRANGVKNASLSYAPPSSEAYMGFKYRFTNAKGELKESYVQAKFADTSYLATFEIPLLAGRNVNHIDTLNEIVVNEYMTKELGFAKPEQALGASIDIVHNGGNVDKDKRIVGVVKNFATNTLRDKITACMIGANLQNYYRLNLKIDMREAKNIFAHIDKTWNQVYPEYFLDYTFLDERIEAFYEGETRFTALIEFFALMTIIIGCIGLYGLVSFMALHKTKEIGVRKVLGASVQSILLMFSKEFVKLLVIAFVIAAPIGYAVLEYVVLVNYANRITIGIPIFLITFFSAVTIASLTVGYKSYMAATQNPAKSLRTE